MLRLLNGCRVTGRSLTASCSVALSLQLLPPPHLRLGFSLDNARLGLMTRISVLIRVYNEAATVARLIE